MTLYEKTAPETIQALFNDIAKRYDITNSILSFQMHRLWNAQLVSEIQQLANPYCLLDLCAGTGDIAYQFLHTSATKKKAILLDFSSEMLACAKKKFPSNTAHEVTFIEGDAEAIPLEDASVDAITIAYGIRNIRKPAACMKESYRVLCKGGVIGILELTRPKNRLLRAGHSLYLKTALPLMGKIMTANKEAYRYLSTSIHHFIEPETLLALMEKEGFSAEARPLFGGIATLFIGKKDFAA